MISVTVVLFSVLNIMLLHYIYPAIYQQNPVAKTIEIVKQAPVVIAYQTYNPGYNFYLSADIKKYDSVDSINFQLQQNPGAIVITRKEFSDSLKRLDLKVVAEHRDLFELPTTVILRKNEKP